MPLKGYKPGTAFPGVIGHTVDPSEPASPEPLQTKEGAPNVLFIVLDDTGFGHLGCYGSQIRTPNMDALADNGLLYSDMHTTALCSADRGTWFTLGHVECRICVGDIHVGLHALVMDLAHTGYAPRHSGTAIRFESFTVWEME